MKTKKKAPAKKQAAAPKKMAPRKDFGAPIDGFFTKQPPHLRAILDELRALVEQAAPDAVSSLKWGMPFYTLDGKMLVALAAFKSHVNLILSGPPGTYADPDGRLEGEAKSGRHLKVRSVEELPRDAVKKWLRAAVAHVRS